MLTDRIKACTLLEDLMIPDDGYIGIPVRACVLFDKDSFKIKHGHGGTPIVLYVKGTAIERIGTLSDDEILCGMLDRGYVIFVLDYLGDKRAVPPMLDWSVQKIRTDMGTGKYFADIECLGAGRYVESMVVPSGYDVADGVFWSIDKHAADGTLEKIAEIWNNDLCGTNAERAVRWVDGSGVRKPTRMATDGTLPVWLDANGCECERGEYIKLKYTFVRDVVDCSRPDGTPIDLDLHMILIYPTKPAKRVPVMCLSGSSEGLRRGSATADRPHLNGFVFRGYMGVMFDYGYTPMAKDDQYGYFDGFPKAGYVTGDNVTYSINHYNDKRIFTAAMRYIRYLGETDERFFIKEDAIGLYGNSKGAWMTFLGEDCDATALNSPRMFAGHHDETRYESGNGAARGFVRAAEPQPWQEVNGKRLSSRAAFIYSSTGGTDNFITENHTPMYISCNRRDSSCYSTSNAFVNVCKRYDVPTMWFEIPSAHTLAYGNDLLYGTDTYSALFDFTGYYLHGDPVRAIAARVNGWAEEKSVTLKLSGAVPASEIAAASLKSENGTVEGKWVSAFGGVEWTFVPTSPLASGEYTLTVPETVSGDNGKRISEAFTYTFKLENRAVASLGYAGESTPLVLDVTDAEVYKLAFYAKEGINTVSAYTEGGEVIGSANVCGEGLYYIDLTDYLRATSLKSVKVYLKAENRERETVFTSSSAQACDGVKHGALAKCSASIAPDGTPALLVSGYKTVTKFPTEEFYTYQQPTIILDRVMLDRDLCLDDMGRSFKISFRIFDTVSRYVRVSINSCTSREKSIADYRASTHNFVTEAGKWNDISITHTVYEPMYGDLALDRKVLTVSCYGKGNVDTPMYICDVCSEELHAPVQLGEAYLISRASEDVLPDGMSEIVCPESPWLNTKKK